MTRINIGIPPADLHDKHLLAEHYEMKRIPNAVRKGRAVIKNIPPRFTLGKGHVKFFYDKLVYLRNRYITVHNECKKRGFDVTDFSSSWDGIPSHLMNDYQPTQGDIQIIQQRIAERVKIIQERETAKLTKVPRKKKRF